MNKNLSLIIVILSLLISAIGVYAFLDNEKPYVVKKPLLDKVDNPWVNQTLSKMTLREKIGQFFMVAAYSNKDEKHFQEIDSLVIKDKVGGIIFFQGDRNNLKVAIDRFQSAAKTPLLIGMDAEWGVDMRLFGEERFPYNYTLGAANDHKLTEKTASMIAAECRDLGIHINFAPVADVNNNPNNPVIGFRSFGENPKLVADNVVATVKGMEGQGVLTSIKHFPGHGDTDVDSHLELPVVNNSLEHIDAIDFFPFRSGINAGASSVMIGHLNVPALDNSGLPSSLSPKIIKEYLQEGMGFDGLVISDALGMKAVTNKYGKVDVVVRAFEAGCDILLFPEIVDDAITAIEKRVIEGKISEYEINVRCKKVLAAKHKAIIAPKKHESYNQFSIALLKKQVFEKAITVLKNEEDALPIKSFDQEIIHVSLGGHNQELDSSMDLISVIKHYNFFTGAEAIAYFKKHAIKYDQIITSYHATSVRPKNDFGMPAGWREWNKSLNQNSKMIALIHGNPLVLKNESSFDLFKSIVVGYENSPIALNRMGQFVMGSFKSQGRLPISIGGKYKVGFGLEVVSGQRLKDSQPEELGISRDKLKEIDAIVQNGIDQGAFPGCQIVVAVDGNIIIRKSYGKHTYEGDIMVKNDHLYDIASVTKVAASTISVMHLATKKKFDLNTNLESYLASLTNGTSYSSVNLKSMLAHQAGFTPWIPFYTKTLVNGKLDPKYYSTAKTDSFSIQVADNLWIRADYQNAMYDEILSTPLKSKTYKYSDLGYYFIKKIVEKQSGMTLDKFTLEKFYQPMGLTHMRYNPLNYFPKNEIAPTENDQIFRKQLIHGYVHDQGAAMLGGVGGHAGIFSNAGDLASLMQLFLNKGSYGGVEYISPEVVDQFTGYQFYPSNRRGAGFDKPTTNGKGGPTCNLASSESYGHSGFTGTLAWSDPKYNINFVFLSNRVYPDAENWKIVSMNIRTDIQRIIYEAVLASKK